MEAKAETNNRLVMELSEEVVHCPSCDAALKPYEVAKHCEDELAQLNQLHTKLNLTNVEIPQSAGTCIPQSENRNTETRKPWSVFRKVQKNRQTRLKLRSRKRPLPEQACPVCNNNFPQDEIHRHAEQCLRRNNRMNGNHTTAGNDDEDESDDGEYEEYEWAGQKRIRASSLLQGGYAALGLGTVITNNTADDDDEDLNVDEDDTQIYGPAQYAESDVIPPTIDVNGQNPEEQNLATYMRHLIAGGNTAADRSQPSPPTETVNSFKLQDDSQHPERSIVIKNTTNSIEQNGTDLPQTMRCNFIQVIESLKSKLRHYENHIQNKFKCLICLDDYRNPAISVSCWHVHCEECWLRSLGSRKLCPQCNLITSPKDLRRIYM